MRACTPFAAPRCDGGQPYVHLAPGGRGCLQVVRSICGPDRPVNRFAAPRGRQLSRPLGLWRAALPARLARVCLPPPPPPLPPPPPPPPLPQSLGGSFMRAGCHSLLSRSRFLDSGSGTSDPVSGGCSKASRESRAHGPIGASVAVRLKEFVAAPRDFGDCEPPRRDKSHGTRSERPCLRRPGLQPVQQPARGRLPPAPGEGPGSEVRLSLHKTVAACSVVYPTSRPCDQVLT